MHERETEVLSTSGLDAAERKRARERKAAIMGDSEEAYVAQFDPNSARTCVDNPAVFEGGDTDA